jgi:hypothetical protein
MQFAKDSFYITLRDRLAAHNAERTVVVDGVSRPALLVTENEPLTPIIAGAFYLRWGTCQRVESMGAALPPLFALDCACLYRTSGTKDSAVDRGRALAALDEELLAICSPHHAPKRDCSVTPAINLGTTVFWEAPQLGAIEAMGGALQRTAKLRVLFFGEEELA